MHPFVDLLLLTNVYLCAPLANFIFFSLHKQPACNYLRTVCLGRVAFGAWCDAKWEKMAYKISPRASARPKSTTFPDSHVLVLLLLVCHCSDLFFRVAFVAHVRVFVSSVFCVRCSLHHVYCFKTFVFVRSVSPYVQSCI